MGRIDQTRAVYPRAQAPATSRPAVRRACYHPPHRGDRSAAPGRNVMSQLRRRTFLAGVSAATAATLTAPRAHAQKSGGTLRFVAQGDLKVLDPVWTTAYITRNHAYLVYDTLFGTDEKLQVRPQMVDKHSVS